MKNRVALLFIIAAISTVSYLALNRELQRDTKQPVSSARKALEFIASVRTYPGEDIPAAGMAKAFEEVQRQRLQRQLAKKTSNEPGPWRAIGPHNVGGRTLALALNPQNTNTLYAGSASGGLWRSYSGGKGPNAWHYVNTGFPVLGVSSIAIAPEDSNIIYIGTGEMYGNPISFPGVLGERLNRGSYGIGILKTTDGGQTWEKGLDWLYNQRRAIQMIRLNPQRPETVWAATTEGTYRSYDAGKSWQQVHDVVMATDLVINNQDTSVVIVACGGMTSPGQGIYRTTDGGASWSQGIIPGVVSFNGKIRLSIFEANPAIVFAGIGRNNGSVFNSTFGTWLAKSEDRGASWQVISTVDYSRLQGWYSHDVAVHPTNPSIVWSAGQSGVPFYSDDGGSNLTAASNRGLARGHPESIGLNLPTLHSDYHHIIFNRNNPGVIYFASDGGVFLSEDGGQTIRNCNRGYQTTQFYNGSSSSETDSLFALGGTQDNGSYAYEGNLFWRFIFGGDGAWTAMDQTNNNLVFTSYQWLRVERSINKGLNFQSVWPPGNDTDQNFIAPFFLSPADNRTMYAGGIFVYKLEDARSNIWLSTNSSQPIDINPAIAMAGSYQSADVVYVVTSPSESGRGNVFKTMDGGDNWQNVTQDLPDRFLIDVVVDPNDDTRAIVTAGGFGTSHAFLTEDGGNSWQDIGVALPDVPAWAAIFDPAFPEQIYVGNDLGVFFSPDNGQTWQPHMQGLPDAVMAIDMTVSSSNRVLRLATHGNGFYESYLPPSGPTSVDETPVLPETITLEQNYPNPFNPETSIRYYLDKSGPAQLSIYNNRGQLIRQLPSDVQTAGWQQVVWDGKDARGQQVASGIYVYRLQVSGQVISKKMTLVR